MQQHYTTLTPTYNTDSTIPSRQYLTTDCPHTLSVRDQILLKQKMQQPQHQVSSTPLDFTISVTSQYLTTETLRDSFRHTGFINTMPRTVETATPGTESAIHKNLSIITPVTSLPETAEITIPVTEAATHNNSSLIIPVTSLPDTAEVSTSKAEPRAPTSRSITSATEKNHALHRFCLNWTSGGT